MNMCLNNIHLEGNLVRLVPLNNEHKDEIIEAASDGELWKLWYTSVPSIATVDNYIKSALKEKDGGQAHAFAVIDTSTNRLVGSTRYCNALNNNRIEIGYTWYAKSSQRTGINTECKYLLLGHAFEVMHCIAVEFRTHWHNHASRNAIARLGAKQDGILRNHLVDGEGNYRDTVVFSITKQEWPTVKKALSFKMKQSYAYAQLK